MTTGLGEQFGVTDAERIADDRRQAQLRDALIKEARERPPNVLLLPRKTDVVPLRAFVHNFHRTHHRLRASIGSAPVETGAVVNDHRQVLPHELDISGIVSDLYHVGDPEREQLFGTGPEIRSNARLAWSRILTMHEDNIVFSVITPWHQYNEMVIEQVDADQRGAEGGAIFFQMKLREVQRARLVLLPAAAAGPAQDRGGEFQRGFQSPFPQDVQPRLDPIDPILNLPFQPQRVSVVVDGILKTVSLAPTDIISLEQQLQLVSSGVDDVLEHIQTPDYVLAGREVPAQASFHGPTDVSRQHVSIAFQSLPSSDAARFYQIRWNRPSVPAIDASRTPDNDSLFEPWVSINADDLSLAERRDRTELEREGVDSRGFLRSVLLGNVISIGRGLIGSAVRAADPSREPNFSGQGYAEAPLPPGEAIYIVTMWGVALDQVEEEGRASPGYPLLATSVFDPARGRSVTLQIRALNASGAGTHSTRLVSLP